MDKIESQIQLLEMTAVSPVAEASSSTPGRLVVVLSDVAETALLAGQILSITKESQRDVLLLGVADNFAHETELRRKLIMLAAFIRDGGARVEIRVDHRGNWLEGLKTLIGANDVLASCVEDTAGGGRVALGDTLAGQFDLPVHILSTPGSSRPAGGDVRARLASWLGSIAIILGFLWLEIRVIQPADDPADTVLLLLSLPVEIGLIWAWNSLVG